MIQRTLSIANEFGNVDLTRQKLSKRYVHVRGKRLQPICRRLRINFLEAVVGFDGSSKYGFRPIKDGVVVSAKTAPKLFAAIEQLRRKRHKRQAQDRKQTGIPAALWTLNRRAKRCRDLAQTYYRKGMHGFAGNMRREKEAIYRLKGQVLHYLAEEGAVKSAGHHKFNGGNWAEVLEGNGYRFHRPCPPPDNPPANTEEIGDIEAKPKGASEPSLELARQILHDFLDGKTTIPVFEWPAPARQRVYRWEDEWDEYDDEWEEEENKW